MSTPPKTAIIIGGSLSGLMTALILRSLSYSVHILERSSVSTLHSQAAGIRAGPELHSFISTYVPDYDPEYALAPDVFEIVKQNGEVEMAIPPTDPLRLTTWKRVYDMFLGTFLGGKDGDGDGDGKAVYETCMKVENIKEEGNGKVLVTYRNLDNDTTRTLTADLVIGADGAHSTVRRIVAQDVDVVQEPQYAGYVTWRGRVPEGNVGQETRRALRKRCVLMRVRDGYMISYYVPSDSASARDPSSSREFVWIWYDTLPQHSPEFAETFTDTNGKKHSSTVPRGKIQPKIWQRVRDRSEEVVLNPHFIDLLRHTSEPFVSAIRDCKATQSVFWGGKVLLVGDAFALCRPHAGGSTSQAAFQAAELKKVLEGDTDLEEWERQCVESAGRELERSLGAAKFFFGGAMPQFVRDMVEKMKE